MRILLFLQRVTFICNLLFILCLVLRYTSGFISNKDLQSYIIILGWFVAFLLGFIVNVWEASLFFNRKVSVGPKWIRAFNLVMFLFQLAYYLY